MSTGGPQITGCGWVKLQTMLMQEVRLQPTISRVCSQENEYGDMQRRPPQLLTEGDTGRCIDRVEHQILSCRGIVAHPRLHPRAISIFVSVSAAWQTPLQTHLRRPDELSRWYHLYLLFHSTRHRMQGPFHERALRRQSLARSVVNIQGRSQAICRRVIRLFVAHRRDGFELLLSNGVFTRMKTCSVRGGYT